MSSVSSLDDDASTVSEFVVSEKSEDSVKSVKSDDSDDDDGAFGGSPAFGFLDSTKTATTSKRKTPAKEKNKTSKKEEIFIFAPKVGEIDKRISPKRMTTFEYASLIGHRADMISKGSPVHPKFQNSPEMDLLKISQMELDSRDIPFPLNIYRPIDNPSYGQVIEVFNPHEPGFYTPTERLTAGIEEFSVFNSWNIFKR
jgi:DNA-directed RNA polymerase subunit K/omega